jgi:hypothetical protein
VIESPPVPEWLGGPSTPHDRPDTGGHPDGPAYSRPEGDKKERGGLGRGGGRENDKGEEEKEDKGEAARAYTYRVYINE